MKINILDSSVYNRISAGEVVERPSSIVKELVENSIDAGATEITISIRDGGTTYINILDNGIGIENSEIKKAFIPHATSKVASVDDLESISTLGFRGEALASIANVCMVTLKSKSKVDEVGKVLEINGGNIVNESECGMNIGTNITVENIFYNTPARKKFLKSNKAEEKYISNLVSRLIMCNPDIAFTYIIDDKKEMQTFANGLKSALDTIYGLETTKNLIKIENTFGNFRLNGYIGNYNYSKPNKTYQTTIINGRFVQNSTISTAVSTAYGEKLMKRTYPFFVLDLVMPFDLVDVNVHPNKTEVRFSDDRKIFSFIYHSVQDCLLNNELNNDLSGIKIGKQDTTSMIEKDLGIKKSVVEENKQNAKRNFDLSSFAMLKDKPSFSSSSTIFQSKAVDNADYDYIKDTIIDKPDETKVAQKEILPEKSLLDFFNQSENSTIIYNQNIDTDLDIGNNAEYSTNQNSDNQNKDIKSNSTIESQTKVSREFTGKIIGQLFDTYILLEDNNEFYLIDQHAVHERIIYEDLQKKEVKDIQNLLIPYVFDTNFVESEFLLDNIDTLNELGIGIEHFGGNSFKISSVPVSMINNDLDSFVKSLLKNISGYKNITSSDILKEKLMQTACKSAIKAGYKFNKEQQEALIKYFIDNDMPLKCPHGRPTMIKFTKQDIEKMFKRIV